MKKVFPLLIICCLLLMACPPLPHHRVYFEKIEYSAQSRGASEYIMLYKGDIKYVQNHQDTITKSMRTKDAKRLLKILDKVPQNLESLKVPSKKHQFDGALAGVLSITMADDTKTTSPTFDDNNPPEEIKELIDYIKNLVTK